MRNLLRMLLCLLAAALLSVSCFAVDDEPAPESDAPSVSVAEVLRYGSETAKPLSDGMVLKYQSAVFHFVLADPMGEGGDEPSGVDLAASRVYLDGCLLDDAAADETDSSLSVTLTMPNGRHLLRIVARDLAGNEYAEDYVLTVRGDNESLPDYTVTADRDYAPLGGSVKFTVHTSTTAYFSGLNVTFKLNAAYPAADCELMPGSGVTLEASSVTVDEAENTISFRVRANLTLSGARDLATITVKVPDTLSRGDDLVWSVPGAMAQSRRNDLPGYREGFTTTERTIPLKAPYTVSIDPLYVGMTEPASIRVIDVDGNAAGRVNLFYEDGSLLGRTNWSGTLTVPGSALAAPGSRMIYASGDVGVSFRVPMTVFAQAGEDGETPVLLRAVSGSATKRCLTWLSPVKSSAWFRYAQDPAGLESASAVRVQYERVSFGASGEMAQVNTITLSALQPGKTYFYQTSYDKTEWAAARSFTVPAAEDSVRFFVLGDMRGAGEDQISAMIRALAGEALPLGLQTGDLVGDGGSLSQWSSALTALSALGDTELFFAVGDHDGAAASALYGRPDGCCSVEYGELYIATIPYGTKADYRTALEWLVKDASASKCPWKILVTHQSPYYTCSDNGNAGLDTLFPAYVERAGIQFVFSGHDQSFARTAALRDGRRAESYHDKGHSSMRGDGAVYYLCGSAGAKTCPVDASLSFDYTVSTDYTAVYLTAEVTHDRFIVRAWDLQDGSPRLFDVYTMMASDCVIRGHAFSENSHYDHTTGKLVCDRCGEPVPVSQTEYSGFASMDSGRAYLTNGRAMTDWFTVNGTLFHAGADARVHKTSDFSTETCTEPGERMAWCADCRESRSYGETVPASGHRYDDAHNCLNQHYTAEHTLVPCGWKGKDVAGLEVKLAYTYGFWRGSPLEPGVTVLRSDGSALSPEDYSVAYAHNTDIGVASVKVAGVGDYLGEKTVYFEIRPANAAQITASDVGTDRVTLSWEPAAGAQRYAVYQQKGSGWTRLGDTADTSYTAAGLKSGTEYTFRIRPFAIAVPAYPRLDGSNDHTFWSPRHSDPLTVKTEGKAPSGFVDVPDDVWFAAPVAWAVANGVTNGTDASHFSPNMQCTRGQMVTFLWRAKCCPEPTQQTSPFEDVADPGAYYYKAVLWAVENGITRGSSATTFSPNAPVTRGMVVTFLHRADGDEPPKGSDSPFVDVESWTYYAESVQWAVEQKITDGVDPTHFSPDTICTRAQIVTFLQRFMTRAGA